MNFKKPFLFTFIILFTFCMYIHSSVTAAGSGGAGGGAVDSLRSLSVGEYNLQYDGVSLKDILDAIHREIYLPISALSPISSPNHVKAKVIYLCRTPEGAIEIKEPSTSFDRFIYESGWSSYRREDRFIHLEDVYGIPAREVNDLEGKAKKLKTDWGLKGVTNFENKAGTKVFFNVSIFAHSEQAFFSHMLKGTLIPPRTREGSASGRSLDVAAAASSLPPGAARGGFGGAGGLSDAERATFMKLLGAHVAKVSPKTTEDDGSGGGGSGSSLVAAAAARALPPGVARGGVGEGGEAVGAGSGGLSGSAAAIIEDEASENVVVSATDIPEAVIINIASTNSPCDNCTPMMQNILRDESEFKNRLLRNWFPNLPESVNLDTIKIYIIYTYKYPFTSRLGIPDSIGSVLYNLNDSKYAMIYKHSI